MAMKLALSMPMADILAFRKVARAYFALLDVLCHNHTAVVATADTATFTFLLTSLDAGLKGLDVAISTQCAAALDNLAGFYFKGLQDTPTPAAQVLRLRKVQGFAGKCNTPMA